MLPIQEIYGLHAHERTQADEEEYFANIADGHLDYDNLPIEMHMELSAAYIEPVKDYKLTEDTEEVTWIFFEYSASQGLAYEKITCSSGSYSATQQIMYRVCRLQTVL